MHPYQSIAHAHYHIADMQATAARHRLARRARRASGSRSPAPPSAEPDFLTAPNWRRPAA